MSALFFIVLGALLGYLTAHRRIEKLTRERDDQIILAARHQDNALASAEDLAAETQAHAETKALVASLEADLVEAGVEASTHANHLTALMDAVAEEKPLTLMKGGRR